MTDIEQRLADDALRVRRDDPPAPALDMLLERAVVRSSRQRNVQVWLAVAAVLVVVAGLVTALALRSSGDSAPPAVGSIPLPTPRTITRDGVTYPVGESSPVEVTRDADPDVVDMYLLNSYDASQAKCSHFSPSARVVSQTSSTVRIVAFDYRKAPLAAALDCAYSPQSTPASPFLEVRLHLDAPLGSRALVDVRSGARLALLTAAEAPRPAHVPAGYRLRTAQGFAPPKRPIAMLDYVNGGGQLSVQFMEAAIGPLSELLPGHTVGHVMVHGEPAAVIHIHTTRCLDWADRTGIRTELCSSGAPRPLPVSELLKVARSLHG